MCLRRKEVEAEAGLDSAGRTIEKQRGEGVEQEWRTDRQRPGGRSIARAAERAAMAEQWLRQQTLFDVRVYLQACHWWPL